MTLTSSAIDAMLPGARLKDDRVAGLEVRRNPTGTSFLLYYRTKLGVVRRPKIGAYPALTLAQAREIARGMLVQVASGDDPVEARNVHKSSPDMDALWNRCAAEHWNRDRQWDGEAASIYTRYIKPKLGSEKVASLGFADFQAIHASLAKTPNTANRMVAVASKMMNLAELWGMRPLGTNPCQHLKRYQERKRRRFGTPDELARIGQALDKLGENPENATGVAFLYCLMFSGARPSEIGNGTPDMVEANGNAGVLRLDKGKTGERAVYLPAQAVRALAKLPKDRKKLAGRTTVPRALWASVLKTAKINGLWARDLRRTFATVALTNGVALGVVGELLGHKSAQTTKVYAKLIEDTAHQTAAVVAGHIEAMITG